ncbi:MAG: ABC transporter permease [Candidatus Moranbacteria bacterium]|nr:ABC transporter permease [Candidatus Moranbacteria bacterium]
MRQIFLALKMAIQNFMIAKMRMFLTILGIVIGVAAVIIVLSVGTSAQNLILDQIRSVGSNLIGVFPGSSEEDGPPAAVLGIIITTLKNSDLEAIENSDNIPHMEYASGYVTGSAKVSYPDYTATHNFQGVSPDMINVENTSVEKGRFFSDLGNDKNARVAVLGSDIANSLFDNQDPQGKKIRIDNNVFKVVGVLKRKGASLAGNPDETIYIPLETAQKQLLGINYINFIRLKVDSDVNLAKTKFDVEELLKSRHNIADDEVPDFSVKNATSFLDMLNNITDIMKFFLTAVAAISLVVGGIGVMNIMFITLHKRIREIGLRMSFGARSRDIVSQFLVESIAIALIGGVLGVILGIIVIYLVAEVAKYYELVWSVVIDGQTILLAIGISLAIGIVFGLYPALKASKISPMEALRHE